MFCQYVNKSLPEFFFSFSVSFLIKVVYNMKNACICAKGRKGLENAFSLDAKIEGERGGSCPNKGSVVKWTR